MPWDSKSFRSRHNHGLSPGQSSKAAAIANAILRRTGNEGLAIRTANARVSPGGYVPNDKPLLQQTAEEPRPDPGTSPIDYDAERRHAQETIRREAAQRANEAHDRAESFGPTVRGAIYGGVPGALGGAATGAIAPTLAMMSNPITLAMGAPLVTLRLAPYTAAAGGLTGGGTGANQGARNASGVTHRVAPEDEWHGKLPVSEEGIEDRRHDRPVGYGERHARALLSMLMANDRGPNVYRTLTRTPLAAPGLSADAGYNDIPYYAPQGVVSDFRMGIEPGSFPPPNKKWVFPDPQIPMSFGSLAP